MELLVCVTCRQGAPVDDAAPRAGAVLLDALSALDWPGDVTLRPVECLSNCSAGCTVVLRGAGRWSYVYGNLGPDQVATVAEGAALYRAAPDGVVPWRARPEHFRKNCIARIPPPEAPR
ncbi:DUF1636 family protein [Rhodobaculum claviforme]|uniref:Metal-binding protein n=1 Tax=Rhodobaculum claviforme TaxID=1549854 RepID=A0A934TJD6_9RHOB|nr:DUF1636 domain-containing protein [Rhodobaculum claviforme]MBK5927245.1 metal-binding protein [Rhodobaculum claviforme]